MFDLAFAAITQVHSSLTQLPRQLQHLRDEDRRALLRKFIGYSRTLLLRLLALARWAKERHVLLRAASSDLERLQGQHIEMRRAADELFFLHADGLWQACVPPYDVRAALDVLCNGTYSQLPRAIGPPLLDDRAAETVAQDRTAALEWMRGVLRLRRCAWRLPKAMEVRDGSGCILCTVDVMFELRLG